MMMPGTYDIIVTVTKDSCVTSDTTSITILDGPSVSLDSTDIVCEGDNNGSIATTVTGGTGPYTYNWSDNTIGNEANPNSLAAGTYDVTVTDANGCTAIGSTTINDGANLQLIFVTTNPDCGGINDGTINATVTGGTGPYTYNWNDNTIGNSATADSLAAGTYIVTVTDANGCTGIDSVVITQGTNITVTLTTTDPVCAGGNDGQISANVSGGTAPYVYTWSDRMTDTASIGNLAPGSYALTVTDANGCPGVASATISAANTVTLTLTATNPTCSNNITGLITATPAGGTTTYRYAWSYGDPAWATIKNTARGT